jgi:hypothetical protein
MGSCYPREAGRGKGGEGVRAEDDMMDGLMDDIINDEIERKKNCVHALLNGLLGSSSNSITPTARKRSNILDFECRAGYPRNPTYSNFGSGSGSPGLSTFVVGTENRVRYQTPKSVKSSEQMENRGSTHLVCR